MKTTLTTNELVLSAVASTVRGTSFVSVKNYKSKSSGNTNNYLILLGYSHENALLSDFKVLQEKQVEIFEQLEKEFTRDIIEVAYNELYVSLEKRLSSDEVKQALRGGDFFDKDGCLIEIPCDSTIARSDGQIDAYEFITKGVQRNKVTELLYLSGLEIRRTLVQKSEIEKKPTKSSEKTICKNKIKNICDFKEAKIRKFIFADTEIKMQGLSIKA